MRIKEVTAEAAEGAVAQRVSIFPVRIHTNLKAEKLEEFERKKKGLHIAAFKFRIEELRISLRDTAVKCARAREFPVQSRYRMIDEFVESIVKQVVAVVALTHVHLRY